MAGESSLRRSIFAIEPIQRSGFGARALVRRLRWEDGTQGRGPLSFRTLQRSIGGTGLRQVLARIDLQPPNSLKRAFERLGMPVGGGITRLPAGPIRLGRGLRRIDGRRAVQLRLLSYNTYLLPGLRLPLGRWIDDAVGWDALGWFGIPFGGALLVSLGIASIPGVALAEVLSLAGITPSGAIRTVLGVDLDGAVSLGAKPALDARAARLGTVLRDYDVCCLSEVYTDASRAAILDALAVDAGGAAFEAQMGPGMSGEWILLGSGLYCLARSTWPIVQTETLVYADRGVRNKDSDAWANKGAMLNVLELGFGRLELFQTHLYFGGGVRDNAPVPIPGVSDPSMQERMNVWRAELAELAEFVRAHHRPENIAIVTGDFNMDAANIHMLAEVRKVMDGLGLHDLWAWDVYAHPPADGQTCRFTDGPEEGWVRDFDQVCRPLEQAGVAGARRWHCDDAVLLSKPQDGVGRFDYLFVSSPALGQRFTVEVSRPLRRPFPLDAPLDAERYQSDHTGLDVTLRLSPC